MTLYRDARGHLEVRARWDGGLEVETRFGDTTTTVALDEFQARDLVNALESWRAGWPSPPIGPAER